MKNHVLLLVHKFAFTQKRTGVKTLPKCPASEFDNSTGQRKLTRVNLDDGTDFAPQVGCADPNFRTLEFLEELNFRLTPEERDVLAGLLAGDDEESEPRKEAVAARIKEKARAIISDESEWQLPKRACRCKRVPQAGASMFNTNKVRSAIKAGDTKVLEEMLPDGLDPNATLKKDKDWTLLHFAAKSGHASMVAELLSVEEAFVTKLLADGKLRHVKLDTNMTRIPASSLRKYIAKLLK